MKIAHWEIWCEHMKVEPYTIAYETVSQVSNVFLRLETNTGIQAFGCAAPDPVVTGETAESVQTVFHSEILDVLGNTDALRYGLILHKLRHLVKTSPSAMAMVDMALHDLLGKVARLPLFRLLGAYRTKIKTSVTIGIVPVDETVERARDWTRQGFRAIKIKGGLDVDQDIARMVQVRQVVGKDVELRFDANQGYTHAETLHFVAGVRKADVALLEQPVPKQDLDLLGSITKKAEIPIMADESLMNLRDAFRMARRHLVDMINIKLMKVGGIAEARQINSVARSARQKVMVGCMDEAALAISAGLHFALSQPNVAYADLDGHLELKGDPSHAAVQLKNGILRPSEQPGLGWQ